MALVGMLVEAVVLALVDLVVLLRVPRLVWASLHKGLRDNFFTSNIPSSPLAMDALTVAFVAPFPELNDGNAVTANLPLHAGPVVLRGFPPSPPTRYWSLQLFVGAERNPLEQTLCDRDVQLREDGRYEVVICDRSQRETEHCKRFANWLDSAGCRKAMICQRAFVVPPGMAVPAPEISVLQPDGSERRILQQNQTRTAGGAAVAESPATVGRRALRVCAVNLLYLLLQTRPARTAVLPVVAGMLLAFLLRNKVGLGHVAGRYKKLVSEYKGGTTPNKTVALADPHGSLKGHPAHMYFMIPYDCRRGRELQIHAWTPDEQEDNFRYTSIHAYKYNSLPLAEYYYDGSVTLDADAEERDGSKAFTVTLTTNPTRDPELNELDVSDAAEGVAFVRIVYPKNEAVVQRYAPTVTLLNRDKKAE